MKRYLYLVTIGSVICLLTVCGGVSAEESLYPVRKDGRYGYIDAQGGMAIEPQWAYAGCFQDGYAIVGNGGQYENGLIDAEGSIIVPQEYSINYQCGVYIVIGDAEACGKYGFFDPQNQTFIPPQYQYITNSHARNNHLILVKDHGKFGYVDRRNGKMEIACMYDEPIFQAQFRDGYAIACTLLKRDDGIYYEFHLIVESGDEILFPSGVCLAADVFCGLSEGRVIIQDRMTGLYGFGDVAGNITVDPQYEMVRNYSEGYAAVLQNGLWGHIDYAGNSVQECSFRLHAEDESELGYSFSNGIALLQTEDDYFAIDYDGNILFRIECDEVFPFMDTGYAMFRNGYQYGLLNRTGEIAAYPEYSVNDISPDFSEGLLAVRKDKKFGFIDGTGFEKIEIRFDDAADFCNGLAYVIIDEKQAYIDHDGHIVWIEGETIE